MLITGYLLLWDIMSYFIPSKMRKPYIIITAFALPALYFGFEPPNFETYDLGRYYIILEEMRKMGVQDILDGNLPFYITTFIGDTNYVALLYFWVISKFGINELLPYITGVIVYYICFRLAYEVSQKYMLTNVKFGIIISYILFLINYGEISGVRNILAFSIIACVLYLDLIKNTNTIFCLMVYAILIYLHTSVAIIFVLRLLLLLRRFFTFKVIVLCCLMSHFFIGIIQKLLMNFNTFSVINAVLIKIMGYSERIEYNYRLVAGSLIILMLCFILALYASKNDKKIFGKYYEFIVCMLAVAIGGISSDVLISRLATLATFLSIPCAVFVMYSLTQRNAWVIKVNNKTQKLIGIMSICYLYFSIAFFAFFHLLFSYIPTFNFFF